MNEHTHTVKGTYGSNNKPCSVFIYDDGYQTPYYAVEGSMNVNQAHLETWLYTEEDEILNVEEIEDIDCFTWSSPIESEEEMKKACEA